MTSRACSTGWRPTWSAVPTGDRTGGRPAGRWCGAPRVARLLVNLARRHAGHGWRPRRSWSTVTPGYVIEVDGTVDQVLSCSVAGDRVVAVRIMRNPDKLPAGRDGPSTSADRSGRRRRARGVPVGSGHRTRPCTPGPPPRPGRPPSPSDGRPGGRRRRLAPRRAHGPWSAARRGHDALETILAQNAGRDPGAPRPAPRPHGAVAVELLPRGGRRHGRRPGLAAPQPASRSSSAATPTSSTSGCGPRPERNLAFDLRDFDETLPGPFEWDVLRLAASLVVAARAGGVRTGQGRRAVRAAVEAYRGRMRRYAAMPELDIWYDGMHVDNLLEYFEPADRGLVSVHIEKKRRKRDRTRAPTPS